VVTCHLTEAKGFLGLRNLYDGVMKKISATQIVILLCLFVISACTPATGTPAQDTNRPLLEREAAGNYSAEFQMQFNGVKNWGYLLKTRKSPALRETSLHIEGLPITQNPGDIRLVTDNVTTWMIGNGTDQECVQFPKGKGMDPTFIYPESLISLTALDGALKLVGEEQLEGLTVLHFRATGAKSDPWKDATIDLLQDKAIGMLRQFTMTATGEDPFFAAGSGKLVARYNAGPLENEAIEPVTGCEISVPLPEGINMFVRLPGMASFESQSSIEDLVKFFQTTLPGQNWTEKEPTVQVKGETVLSYQRDGEEVEIHIEKNPEGKNSVKVLFIQGQ
jgi:hypothetical protein